MSTFHSIILCLSEDGDRAGQHHSGTTFADVLADVFVVCGKPLQGRMSIILDPRQSDLCCRLVGVVYKKDSSYIGATSHLDSQLLFDLESDNSTTCRLGVVSDIACDWGQKLTVGNSFHLVGASSSATKHRSTFSIGAHVCTAQSMVDGGSGEGCIIIPCKAHPLCNSGVERVSPLRCIPVRVERKHQGLESRILMNLIESPVKESLPSNDQMLQVRVNDGQLCRSSGLATPSLLESPL